MPLNPSTLVTAIDEFGNPDSPAFIAFPADEADAAVKLAAAFKRYMLEIVNPPPGAGTVAGHNAGEAAMRSALAGMSAPAGVGIVALKAGFVAYVAAFFATTAPVVSFAPPGAPLFPPTMVPGAGTLAFVTFVDTWIRTGTASVPPATPLVWG